jgi:hypothetical protein
MNKWERSVERGMGYLGLFMIGSMAWLADHLGWTSEKEETR